MANDPAVVWGTAGAKALAGLLALALVRPWGRAFPRRALLVAAWSASALLALYGAANLVDHGRMVAGIRTTPEFLGERAARWHLLLWDPVWLLGSVLFLAAAWRVHRPAGGRDQIARTVGPTAVPTWEEPNGRIHPDRAPRIADSTSPRRVGPSCPHLQAPSLD